MKITLCGSTRFEKEYIEANVALSKAGHVVYTCTQFGTSSLFGKEGIEISKIEKENLDLVHLAKILNSDAIVVVGRNESGPYIGESTRREIVWARMHGKDVYFGLVGILSNEYQDLTNVGLLIV